MDLALSLPGCPMQSQDAPWRNARAKSLESAHYPLAADEVDGLLAAD